MAGAIFSGFAMVVTLLVIAREVFNLKRYITMDHLEKMNKIILATGMLVGYAYACEFFIAWYSGSSFEQYAFINRAFGPYWWAYWTMAVCNVVIPQIFLIKIQKKHPCDVCDFIIREYRDVVRAFCDHCDFVAP